MKASFYRVESTDRESFRCRRICDPNLGTPWHFHPEYQITLVVRGVGHRIVGDTITQLRAGDLTLLGPNLPHFWHTGDANGSCPEALIVHFREDFLGERFFAAPELRVVHSLLRRSVGGLHFTAAMQHDVAPHLAKVLSSSGPERVIELLAVLARLAHARARPICTSGFLPDLDRIDQQRLERVCQHIHENFTTPIFRDELAQLIGLSPRTFSRYFHQKMGKTLPQFVNELRISRACRLLLETDRTVSEIAFQCGFENLSTFNSRFRAAKRTTPSSYRAAKQWK